jgi:hypothetical protein
MRALDRLAPAAADAHSLASNATGTAGGGSSARTAEAVDRTRRELAAQLRWDERTTIAAALCEAGVSANAT